MPNIRGSISVSQPITKQLYLHRTTLNVGSYTTTSGHQASSRLTCWVPQPTDVTAHIPGVFIRLQNAFGSSYTRMDIQDLTRIITWLSSQSVDISEAFSKAQQWYNHLQDVHKTALQLTSSNTKLIIAEEVSSESPECDAEVKPLETSVAPSDVSKVSIRKPKKPRRKKSPVVDSTTGEIVADIAQ